MIHYQTVRRPLNEDLQQWFSQNTHLTRSHVQKIFFNQMTPAQRKFIHSIYSWGVDRDTGRYYVLLTVTNEKQATLASLIF